MGLIFTSIDLEGAPGGDVPAAKGQKGVSILESNSLCSGKSMENALRGEHSCQFRELVRRPALLDEKGQQDVVRSESNREIDL